jgi:lipopolysaccharide export system protein LptA
MSKALFTVNISLAAIIFFMTVLATPASTGSKESPIVITSDSLIADNKKNTAIFEGSVVATTDDITIFSDRMTVFYTEGESRIVKIHAVGNIRVQKDDTLISSDEAIYFEDEEKIIFSGNPKVTENDNSIAGTRIIYFLKDDRAVIEGSKVLIKNKED